MQGNIYRLSAVKCDGRQVLVKERFEHNYFISIVQEGREDSVLPCASWLVNKGWCQKKCRETLAFVSPACDKDLRINI